MLAVFTVLSVLVVSCTGPAGPEGPAGVAGPEKPGLYYVKIFQQGVYPAAYNGQIQSSIFDSMGGSFYTNSSNPINLGRSAPGGIYRALIRFDLTAIPSTKVMVDRAQLIIRTNSASAGGGAADVKVHRLTNTWQEFNNGWSINTASTYWNKSGGDFASNTMTVNAAVYDIGPNTTTTIELDASVVQEWVLNPAINYGMLLKSTDENITNYAEIYPSGAAIASNRPMLKVWYYTTE